jgi:chloramphenicol 3-O-phosphotransferase
MFIAASLACAVRAHDRIPSRHLSPYLLPPVRTNQLDRLLLSVSAGPPADTMRSVSKAVRAITNPIFLPENLRMDKADSARIRIDCLALLARFRFHTVGLAAASEDGASRIQCEKVELITWRLRDSDALLLSV